MHLRTLLVDHESIARERIKAFLAAQPDVEVLAECADGLTAVHAIYNLHPDVIFLELEIPDLDGLGVLQQVREITSLKCIVTTANEKYEEQAFEAEAFDYLLKPFSRRQFTNALKRVRNQNESDRQDSLQRRTSLERVKFRSRGKIVFLHANEISFIEVTQNGLSIHTSIETHHCREPLLALCQRLDMNQFLRIDAKTIVNRSLVERVVHDGPGCVLKLALKTGITLPVSVSHRHFIDQAGLAI